MHNALMILLAAHVADVEGEHREGYLTRAVCTFRYY